MEVLIFAIIAAAVSYLTNDKKSDKKKKPVPKRSAVPKKPLTEQQQAIQPLVEQLKDIQPLKEKAEPRRGRLTAAPAPVQPALKQEPEEWIGKWTEDDLVKGIVFSEVFGPPKAKRKK